MTPQEHRQRHIELHAAFEELLADFIAAHRSNSRDRGPSTSSVIELLQWSCRQANRPDATEHERTSLKANRPAAAP